MAESLLRIGLVGAAGKVAAPCHLNAYRMVDRIQLVAVCDLECDALDRVGNEQGVLRRYTDYQELLEQKDIDAVDLVVPPTQHASMSIAAARAGKHVYVEKPMAHSIGQAQSMIDTADAMGVLLMVGESYFFHAPHVLAAELIDGGEIGDVLQLRHTKLPWVFTSDENERLGGRGHDVAWRFDPQLSGGGEFPWMIDHGPHLFATARLLSGRRNIHRVTALAREHGYGPEQHLRGITGVTWVYQESVADGIWTHVETEPNAVPWTGFYSEVFGTRGSLRVFGEGGGSAPEWPQVAPVTLYRDGRQVDYDPQEEPDRSWRSNNCYYDRAHAHALISFADAVLDGKPLCYDGRDGQRDLAATLATIQSAIEGRAVLLDSVPQDWTAYRNA